jgi:AraC-like DNA-binding protein
MSTILLSVLIAADLVLLLLAWRLSKDSATRGSERSDFQEEHTILSQMRLQVENELRTLHKSSLNMMEELKKIATFYEMEKKGAKQAFSEQLTGITKEFQHSIEASLNNLDRYHDKVFKRKSELEAVLKSCNKAVGRAEIILKGMSEKLPLETILGKLNNSRLETARQLLSKGHSSAEIAAQVGLSSSEIELLRGRFGSHA